MRKIWKILLSILGVVLLIVVALAAYVYFAPQPTYEDVPVADLRVTVDSASVARGQKLVMSNCQGCHASADGTLSGLRFEDEPANEAFGEYFASNITQHPTAGIGDYSDGELYRFLRTGIKNDHTLGAVMMPRWILASDQDIHDMIAFLRSDHPAVAASDRTYPPHVSTFLERALKKFAFKPYPLMDEYPERPRLADSVAYGEYLVQAVNLCYACHSADLEANDLAEPENSPGYLNGGYTFALADHEITTPGLLLQEGNNIKDWTIDDFVHAVKFGQRPNNAAAFQKPMHPYPLLDTAEVRAIYLYLADFSK
ncbi:MAG: c-type cytochrome [Lewinella sp.]|nr:c-type cytochrome [Lewinella sp.]